jgi:hypothetical protein
MTHDPTLSAIIAAARRRAPRRRREGGAAKKNPNNYVAERGPNWGNREGAGARPANDNAAKSSAELRRLFAHCQALCRSARQLLASRRNRMAP